MDFSEFSSPDPDWLRYTAENPRATVPLLRDAKVLRSVWLEMKPWNVTPPETAAAVTKTALLLPPSATSTRTTALPGTLYTPLSRPFARALLPLYFYVHGGAFLFGSLAASDAECARIARALGVVVVHVDYRHTDDAPYPAQHDDAMDALRWAVQQAESWGADADRVVVSGESAGASLAVGVAVRAAKEGIPISLLHLGSPWVVHPSLFPMERIADGKASLTAHAVEPGPSREFLEWTMELLQPEVDARNYDISPLLRPVAEWKKLGLPKTFVQVAGMDPLRDEGILFVGMLKDAGVDVRRIVYPGVPHAFHHTLELAASKVYEDDHDKEVRSVLSWGL